MLVTQQTSLLVTPTSPRKRKRKLDDNMDRETVHRRVTQESNSSFFDFLTPVKQCYRVIRDAAASPFMYAWAGVPAKSGINKRLQVDVSRSRREDTPGAPPGAFPKSPRKAAHNRAVPAKSSRRRTTHRSKSIAERKERKWDEIAQSTRTGGGGKQLSHYNYVTPVIRTTTRSPGSLESEQKIEIARQKKLHEVVFPCQQATPVTSPLVQRDVLGTARNYPRVKSTPSQTDQPQLPATPSSIASDKLGHQHDSRTFRDVGVLTSPIVDVNPSLNAKDRQELTLYRTQRSRKFLQKVERRYSEHRTRDPSPGYQEAFEKFQRDYQAKKLQAEKAPLLLRMPTTETLAALPSLAGRSDHEDIHVYGKYPVRPHDFKSIEPFKWLNDNVINAWLDELCRQARAKFEERMKTTGVPITDGIPRYHAINTTWYPTMIKPEGGGVDQVVRWAKRAKIGGANLLKVHKILIPLHVNSNHWTLLVILPQRRLVRYYDSFNGDPNPFLDAAKKWITVELESANAWEPSEWNFDRIVSSEQRNGADCGVFTSMNAFATFYTENPAEVLPSEPMSTARALMSAILRYGGFRDEFDLEKWHPDFRLETDRVMMNGTA